MHFDLHNPGFIRLGCERCGLNPSLKILRRLSRIDALSDSEQKALLKTVDMFIKAAGR